MHFSVARSAFTTAELPEPNRFRGAKSLKLKAKSKYRCFGRQGDGGEAFLFVLCFLWTEFSCSFVLLLFNFLFFDKDFALRFSVARSAFTTAEPPEPNRFRRAKSLKLKA